MDINAFEKNHEKLIADNGFCRKLSLLLAATLLILVAGFVMRTEVVTVTPPEMHDLYQIGAKKASESYKTAWALSMAKLVGNMSREEAPYIIKQLSAMLTPDIYNNVRKALYSHIETLEKKKITTTFTVKEVYFEKKTEKVFVNGTMLLNSLVSKKKEVLPYTFEFKVQISDYKPAISHFDFYPGKPRAEGVNFDRGEEQKEAEKGA
jgi:conjugal transfer pilus assembly protein TraE